VQAVNEMGVGRGKKVCRKGCPYIRQLANSSRRVAPVLAELGHAHAHTHTYSGREREREFSVYYM